MALFDDLRLFAPPLGAAAGRGRFLIGCAVERQRTRPDRRGRLLQRSHRPSDAAGRRARRRGDQRRGRDQRPAARAGRSGRLRRPRLGRLRRERPLRLGRRPPSSGHLFSGTTLAAAPVYNGGGDPVVADLARRLPRPRCPPRASYTFRVCPSDLAHGAALAHWVRDRLAPQRGAVLYLNDEYGRGIRQTFVAEFVRLGGELAGRRSRISATSPTWAPISTAWRAVTSARVPRGGRQPGRGRGDHPPGAQARPRRAGARRRRARGHRGRRARWPRASTSRRPTSRSIPTAANRRFVEAYRRKFPDAGLPNQPAAGDLRCRLPAAGRDRPGRDRPGRRSGGRSRASGSVTPPFEGVTGAVAFDALGDVPDQNVYVGLVRSGAVEVVNGADAPEGTR